MNEAQHEAIGHAIQLLQAFHPRYSDEIDARTWCALKGYRFIAMRDMELGTGFNYEDENGETFENVATIVEYRETFAAVKALVPDGWEWMISNRAPAPHGGRAYVRNRQPHSVTLDGSSVSNPEYRGYEAIGRDPFIALVIACLMQRFHAGIDGKPAPT